MREESFRNENDPRAKRHGDQAVEKGADRKMCKTKTEKTELQSKKYNQLKAKAIYKKTSEKSEVFTLFAISSSVVPLYADELEMTKSASFSTALTSFYQRL